MSKFIIVLIVLALLLYSVVCQSPCGGTLEGDSGFLSYEAGSENNPKGELCVWTISLQARNSSSLGFILHFHNATINIPGGNEDCTEGALRFYSLSQYRLPAQGERFTLCNENKPEGQASFQLSHQVMLVSFFTKDRSSRFAFSWSGITNAYYSDITLTSNTVSSATGFLQYPAETFERKYFDEQQITWLFKNDNNTLLDIYIHSMDLEPCFEYINRCWCDVLMIFQITWTGVLEEMQRFCSSTLAHRVVLRNLYPNLLIHFITDFTEWEYAGEGFSLSWKEATSGPIATPPPIPQTIIETKCGGVLKIPPGGMAVIEYKLHELYQNYEKCVWTVRSHRAARLIFNLVENGMEDLGDQLAVHTYAYRGGLQNLPFVPTILNKDGTVPGQTANLTGSMAFVIFRTSETDQFTGFHLEVTAEGMDESDPTSVYDESEFVTGRGGGQSYPPDSTYYSPNHYSSFVISKSGSHLNSNLTFALLVGETNFVDGCPSCSCNFILVYGVRGVVFEYLRRVCNPMEYEVNVHYDTYVIIYQTFNSTDYTGYNTVWLDADLANPRHPPLLNLSKTVVPFVDLYNILMQNIEKKLLL